MKFVISRAKKVSLIFSLTLLLCFNAKLLSTDNQDQAHVQLGQLVEFVLTDQELQYIQMHPEEELAYIPYEILEPLASAFENDPNKLTDPSFSHVHENLKNSLRLARYSDLKKVVSQLPEGSLGNYRQQLETGEALITGSFDQQERIVRSKSCRPKLTSYRPKKVIGCKLIPAKPGPSRATGTASATGATGSADATSSQGPQSVSGLASVTGSTGPQGVPGPAGATGPQGPKGIPGLAGRKSVV